MANVGSSHNRRKMFATSDGPNGGFPERSERESESDTKKRRNGTHVIAGKHVLQMQSSKVCFFSMRHRLFAREL